MIGRTSATLLLAFMFPLSLGRGDQGVRTGPVPDPLLAGFSWRNLGPFRSGRVSAVSGAIGISRTASCCISRRSRTRRASV